MRRRSGGFCCYCKRGPLLSTTAKGHMAFTFDHIVPKAANGYRRVPCCRQCNTLKADLQPAEWFWFIDNHPLYWKEYTSPAQVAAAVAAERVRRVRDGEPPFTPYLMGSYTTPYVGGVFNG